MMKRTVGPVWSVLSATCAVLACVSPCLAQGSAQPDAVPAIAPPPPPPPMAPRSQHDDAEPASAADRGQVERGFVIRASLGGRVGYLSSLSGSGSGNAMQVGLFLGGKLGRVVAGAGLEFQNLSGGSGSSSSGISSLLVVPEIMAAVASSADRRVEFVLDFALGLGAVIESGGGDDRTFQLSYQLGPGVRFWAHRHFALQGLTGFSGFAAFPEGSSGVPSVHGIFASFGLLGAI